jgi:MFS family permease
MSSSTPVPSGPASSNASGNLEYHLELDSNPDLLEKAEILTPEPAEARLIHGLKWFIACIALYSTALLYGLDTTIAADVQPAIVETFGNIEKLAWIGSGFPLGSVATILPLGYAYGQFNIKKLYLLSIILFEGGSALCGGANNMDALIIGRVIAGIGGAGMYLGVLNYISVFTSMRERTLYTALTGLVWGTGTILGPVVGGGFAISGATWRWSFYINLVIAAVSAPALLLCVPNYQPPAPGSFLTRLRQMDWLGITLNAAMYVTFVLALTFGGGQWAWGDGREIAMLVVFGVITFTFVVTQYFAVLTTKERRIFPGHLLRHRNLIFLYIGTACAATALFVAAYYIPLFFQFAQNDSAIKAAVRLLPFIITAIFFIMLNGALMPVVGYYMPWYFISGVFLIIGGSLMYTIDATTSTSKIYGYSVLMAVGAGVSQQLGYSVAAAKVKPQDVPAAIGFINTAQLGSIVIALSISGSVFQNVAFKNLKDALSEKGFSIQDIRGAIAGTQSAIFESGSHEIRDMAINAIIDAMDKVYALVIAAGALALVVSLFMKREKLFMAPVAGG